MRRGEATLRAKECLVWLNNHPEGVTRKDLDAAGHSIKSLEKLIKLKKAIGSQIKEPERGPRAYHWRWYPSVVNPHTQQGEAMSDTQIEICHKEDQRLRKELANMIKERNAAIELVSNLENRVQGMKSDIRNFKEKHG